MKIPLLNSKGNFTNVESIMTFDGTFVGRVDRMAANDEKQKEASGTHIRSVAGLIRVTPITNPTANGTKERNTPNTNEARMSPRIMAVIDTGEETSLSKVLACPSHGMIAGTTAVAVKKIVIDIKLDNKNLGGTFLPTKNAANKKSGIRIPKTTTGPLR
jgi:hypothetical protein